MRKLLQGPVKAMMKRLAVSTTIKDLDSIYGEDSPKALVEGDLGPNSKSALFSSGS